MEHFEKLKTPQDFIPHYQLRFIIPISAILTTKRQTHKEVAELLIQIQKIDSLAEEIPGQNLVIAEEINIWLKTMGPAAESFKRLTYRLRTEN